jgi:hypothetical protein
MPKDSFSSQLQDLAVETLWSLWTELGVSGSMRRHSDVGIDLEPLILATAYLGRFDARVLEESLDWCVTNSRFVSSNRLRNLLKAADAPTRDALGRYAATVRKRRRVSWPGVGQPYAFSPTRRSLSPDLKRPALVQLRLRALLGVSARAEVLRWLLAGPDRFVGSLELATMSAYGKDNVADTLDLLARAGVVAESTMTTSGNQRVFRIDRNSELARALLQWSMVPEPRWDACLRVTVSLVEFAQSSPSRAAARAAAIQGRIRTLQSDLRWLGTFPALRQGVEAVNEDFDKWATRSLRSWARAPEVGGQDGPLPAVGVAL